MRLIFRCLGLLLLLKLLLLGVVGLVVDEDDETVPSGIGARFFAAGVVIDVDFFFVFL